MSLLRGETTFRGSTGRRRLKGWYQRQKSRFQLNSESVILLRLTGWLFFGVGCSLLPLAVDLMLGIPESPQPTLFQVLSHGELFIIVTVLTASGLGELFFALTQTGPNPLAKLLAFGGCVWVMLITLVLYIGTTRIGSDSHDINSIGWQSVAMFASGLVATGSCIYIAAKSR